jgi:hypothetical protein
MPTYAGERSQTNDGEQNNARERERERGCPRSGPHAAGMLWFGGWLFTIGFAKLVWWKAALALVVWPYFVGVTIR